MYEATWIRKGGLEKRPVDGFPDAARRIPFGPPVSEDFYSLPNI